MFKIFIENLLKMSKWAILAMLFIMFAVVSSSAGSEKGKVVARGDGVVVTVAEVNAMRNVYGGHPTNRGLLEGTVKMVLFAKEALEEKIACPAVADVAGFEQTITLANCYIQSRLDSMDVRDDAVESYYRAYWQRFVNKKTGELDELDADLRQRIMEQILTVKKKHFGNREFMRLCEKYNIIFTKNGS